jgi:hypothetical protein
MRRPAAGVLRTPAAIGGAIARARRRVHDAPRPHRSVGFGVPGSSGVHCAPQPPIREGGGASCTRPEPVFYYL